MMNSRFMQIVLMLVIPFFVCFVSFLNTQNNVALIPRAVLFGNPVKSYPSLSPDGTRLAYCAPLDGILNIWVKTVGKEDDKVITHETKRGISSFSWASNGKQLLYLQDTNGDENYHLFAVDSTTGEIKDFTLFSGVKARILAIDKDYHHEILIEMNKENPKFFDVYHLDLITGDLSLVAKNPGTYTRWIVGRHLQLLGALQTNSDGSQDLFIRASNNEDWKKLLTADFEDTLKDDLYSGILGFDKDNTHLYLNTSLGTNTRSLQRIDIKTGIREIRAEDPEFDIVNVIFDATTYEPEIIIWNKERRNFKLLNNALQEDYDRIKALGDGDLYTIRKTYDNKKALVAFVFDNKSVEYYLYNFDTKESRFLFHQRPELNEYQLSPMEPISFIARDGLKIRGYLTCPLNVERKNLPLVLLVHGGPFMRDSWEFTPVVQLLSNRGFACLQVNYRGSAGYGKSFLAKGNGEWGGKMQDDLIDAVNWAIDEGVADPKKIVIFGGSYGGYAALVGATFTPDLFCCAIDCCGISNLLTVLQNLPPYWSLSQWEKRIGKISDEEFLKSRSPLFKIENIKIPILIVHGANDVRVKQAESEQIVKAMNEKGLEYEYLLFPDEGHGLVRPQNRLKFYATVEKFLSKHVGCRFEN